MNEIAEKCFIKQLNIGDTPLQILWNVGDSEGQLQALSAYFSNPKVQQLQKDVCKSHLLWIQDSVFK